jgi:branched-chain amino acid transport system substrate-binding protein
MGITRWEGGKVSEGISKSWTANITRRAALAGIMATTAAMPIRLRAQDKAPLRIGVLNDQSGPFADLSGLGSLEAAKLAVEDHGGRANGVAVEVLAADHQNRPDIGTGILRKWLDVDNVQAVFDLGNSAISLAAQQIMRERNRIIVHSTSATSDLTGSACSPVGFHWVYDTYSNSAGIAKALMSQGLDTWFFVTVDYAFGKSMEAVARTAIEKAGGKVVGAVRHPLNTSDFSSYLLQAQSSNAKVIVFANAGVDLTNCIKQAAEFRLSKLAGGSQTVVAPVMLLTDVHAIGLKLAQGLSFISGFYWDKDDETRAWSRRFFERRRAMPTMSQAGVYSAVRHFLKAADAAKTTAGIEVASAMRAIPVSDMFTKNAVLRADGRLVHDMLLVEVKAPEQSKYPWDYYSIKAVLPGAEAFRPLDEGGCSLVRT